jgi:circadian clock protein KaiB
MSDPSETKTESKGFVFRLFVAGDEHHSKTARDRLREICEFHLNGRCKIEIVDVFKSSDLALENGIFLTPALMKMSPPPRTTIFGNLSDSKEVLRNLRVGEK